ncbi:MAG: bifunctional riboflavin kinase/FAD synthetase [Proteobacteria bacterium]|nr:bifunctional riboflavin kinase/FAD synthetase [Desulfobulbaceae bacterium]MBU4154107.1 bifunctional riboflavin kinase/FAD synthetase [Pseudomonadota bacterium]MDP2105528.1 bifunctional riboflavin kinase/FAD synthetase [Desulfobulbaceae bacterium]
MKIHTDLDDITHPFTRPFVTIGNFDGVHLGHQILFSEVVNKAYLAKGTSVAITFAPHPLKVIRPDIGIKLISTCEQKRELIAMANIDVLIIIPFTKDFAHMPAETFVDRILRQTIGVQELVVGYDYAFGKGRQGDIPFLRAQGEGKGFKVSVVEPFYVDGILASSTMVRKLVNEGRMRDVRKLLGRPYQIRGEVKVGKQRGGPLLGFRTANLHIAEDDLCPRHGVYVTQVIYDGKCYGGVLNIGYNPTFNGEQVSAETHIFDFNQDIYGKPIKINLLQYLRDEKKFAGPAELVSQITTDITEAKEILRRAQKELTLSCEERFNR